MVEDISYYYLDSSIVVKQYAEEIGSKQVRQLLSESNVFITSAISYAEAYASFHRIYREQVIGKSQLKTFKEYFEEVWKNFYQVEFDSSVRQWIPQILAQSPLRGADAIHLASACHFRQEGGRLIFSSADFKLLQAAQDHQFEIWNPLEPS